MSEIPTSVLPTVELMENAVFPRSGDHKPYIKIDSWESPITYFVGRNGSGKSRTARRVADNARGHFLSTDRLTGIMGFQPRGWGYTPKDFQGLPLDESARASIRHESTAAGTATEEYFALREQPEVLLRVAAFLRRALNRHIELRETSGYLDPFVRLGNVEYSLLRDEGHGLRELVALLAAAYRKDWNLLVVDEPELHLHPSMLRIWLGELERECRTSGRKAIIVTHEPSAINPRSAHDLNALWIFQPGSTPIRLGECVEKSQELQVAASLVRNPKLVSQLVFAPRPVLVEGILDVGALSIVLNRNYPVEVVAQTELIDCGGSGNVALWFSIGRKAGFDFKAIADLDACLESRVQNIMDATPEVARRYQEELGIEPPKTHLVIQPLIAPMRTAGVGSSPKERAKWLAEDVPGDTGYKFRMNKLLNIWRDAGLWLHSKGTLEDVLGVTNKNMESVQARAEESTAMNDVAAWAAFVLDSSGDVKVLLRAAVERIAHSIQVAQGLDSERSFTSGDAGLPAGDSQLVHVESLGSGQHRITVKAPDEFTGYWMEFGRDTPPSAMELKAPSGAGGVA